MQAPSVSRPQTRRERAKTGLVIDGIEWLVWLPVEQVGLFSKRRKPQPFEKRTLRCDRAWRGVHHRDVEASLGKRQRLQTASATWDQNAALRENARTAPNEEGGIQAMPFPTGVAIR